MVRVTEHVEEATRKHSKALVLYPAYWDAKRTVAAGRKVALSLAVEYPTVQDVAECCAYLGLPPEVQQKAYCRDVLTQPVRLRVALHNELGILINPQVPTRASPASPCYSLAPCHERACRPARPQHLCLTTCVCFHWPVSSCVRESAIQSGWGPVEGARRAATQSRLHKAAGDTNGAVGQRAAFVVLYRPRCCGCAAAGGGRGGACWRRPIRQEEG